MLHFKVRRRLPKEQYARSCVNKFFTFGASAHRLGNSTEFDVLIPIKRPERIKSVEKLLQRNSLGEEFDLVWVTSFEGGPQYIVLDESDIDERGRLLDPSKVALPADDEFDDFLAEPGAA